MRGEYSSSLFNILIPHVLSCDMAIRDVIIDMADRE